MADEALSDDVRAHLTRLGIRVEALPDSLEDDVGVRALVGLVESSLTLEEAAKALNTTTEDVAARAARRDLYVVPLGPELRVPSWQVLGGCPLPGLSALLAGLPEGLHPLAVTRLMSTADDALDGMSPVE